MGQDGEDEGWRRRRRRMRRRRREEGRPGSGDWKMTIWCIQMAELLFLEY